MEGCGALKGREPLEPSHPRVQSFAFGDTWKLAEEPLHWLQQGLDRFHWWSKDPEAHQQDIENEIVNRTKGAGLGLPFAKAVRLATGLDIDLLPAAHGGTSMDQWSPDHKHLGTDSLYAAMIRRTKLAMETKPQSKLTGVLWYQGESDGNPAVVDLYHDRMRALIAAVRADLDAPDLPFYLTQLGPFASLHPQPEENVQTWNKIREVQRTLPNEIKHVVVVPAIDLDLDDGIHIGTLGLKRLGKRFANVALRNVYGQQAPTPISLASVKLVDRTITVKFSGVNGTLVTPDPAGRVFGFGLSTKNVACDTNAFHKANITGPNEVSLYLNIEMDPSYKLWYGYGWHPVCQLADTADMAVPAFGPVEIR